MTIKCVWKQPCSDHYCFIDFETYKKSGIITVCLDELTLSPSRNLKPDISVA